MSRTISTTLSAGITLSSGDNPVSITATGRITASTGDAVYGYTSGSTPWTVANAGTIVSQAPSGGAVYLATPNTGINTTFTNQSGGLITALQTGVDLNSSGVIVNQANATITSTTTGLASAVYIGGTGTIINAGLLKAGNVAAYERLGGSVTNLATGTIAGAGGVYLNGAGTVTNAGTIIGTDTRYGAILFNSSTGSSRLIVDPGAVFTGEIISRANSSNVIELASGSSAGTLSGFDGNGITNFAGLQFDTGADWTVKGSGAPSGLGSVAITGFTIGDTIDLTGFVAVSKTFANNALVLTNASNAHTTLHIQGSFSSGNFAVASYGGSGTALTAKLACFAEGTTIATPTGHCPVEALKAGDLVQTVSGAARPVRWIGFRALDLTCHPAPERAQPIRITAGAFADNIPSRDLLLSPDHAVLLDGVLIPVKLLRNDASIVREADCRSVVYYHVELDTHDVLLAEGLAAESYLDTGNRGIFQNAGVPLDLHPTFDEAQAQREGASCAPFVTDPRRVEPQWHALAARATAVGGLAVLDTSPSHCLIAAGRMIGPISQTAHCLAFLLPAGTDHVRLVSFNFTQPWIDDPRCLALAVTRLTLRAGSSVETLPLDHPGLSDGWWEPERDGERMWRWTNGDGAISLDIGGPTILEVQLAEAPIRPSLLVA